MKKIVISTLLIIAASLSCNAQTYLETLQKEVPGQGSVTVKQSKEIDDLVNGVTKEDVVKANTETTKQPPKKEVKATSTSEKETEVTKKPVETRLAEPIQSDSENANTTIDTSRKIMRGSYKITGYRVQAFSGGNSRVDKNKAREIGDAIKQRFPTQPVYVHFYSPRWTCRIGNYRTYEEAKQVLNEIKAMGYTGASIVKGKITVQ